MMFPVIFRKIYINRAAGNTIHLCRLQEPFFLIVEYFTEFNHKRAVSYHKGYFCPQIFKKSLIFKTKSDIDWIIFPNLDLNQNHHLSFIHTSTKKYLQSGLLNNERSSCFILFYEKTYFKVISIYSVIAKAQVYGRFGRYATPQPSCLRLHFDVYGTQTSTHVVWKVFSEYYDEVSLGQDSCYLFGFPQIILIFEMTLSTHSSQLDNAVKFWQHPARLS